MANDYKYLTFFAGDICLSADNSWFGNTINFFQSIWTKDAKYSHAFMFVYNNELVEALTKITLSTKSKYNNRKLVIYRLPIDMLERNTLEVGLRARVNGAYGWDKYPLFVLDATTTWIKQNIFRMKAPCFFFTKTFHISNIPVCSELVVWALHKYTSYRLKDENGNEVPWTIVTPDYLQDLLELPINEAINIYDQEEIK